MIAAIKMTAAVTLLLVTVLARPVVSFTAEDGAGTSCFNAMWDYRETSCGNALGLRGDYVHPCIRSPRGSLSSSGTISAYTWSSNALSIGTVSDSVCCPSGFIKAMDRHALCSTQITLLHFECCPVQNGCVGEACCSESWPSRCNRCYHTTSRPCPRQDWSQPGAVCSSEHTCESESCRTHCCGGGGQGQDCLACDYQGNCSTTITLSPITLGPTSAATGNPPSVQLTTPSPRAGIAGCPSQYFGTPKVVDGTAIVTHQVGLSDCGSACSTGGWAWTETTSGYRGVSCRGAIGGPSGCTRVGFKADAEYAAEPVVCTELCASIALQSEGSDVTVAACVGRGRAPQPVGDTCWCYGGLNTSSPAFVRARDSDTHHTDPGGSNATRARITAFDGGFDYGSQTSPVWQHGDELLLQCYRGVNLGSPGSCEAFEYDHQVARCSTFTAVTALAMPQTADTPSTLQTCVRPADPGLPEVAGCTGSSTRWYGGTPANCRTGVAILNTLVNNGDSLYCYVPSHCAACTYMTGYSSDACQDLRSQLNTMFQESLGSAIGCQSRINSPTFSDCSGDRRAVVTAWMRAVVDSLPILVLERHHCRDNAVLLGGTDGGIQMTLAACAAATTRDPRCTGDYFYFSAGLNGQQCKCATNGCGEQIASSSFNVYHVPLSHAYQYLLRDVPSCDGHGLRYIATYEGCAVAAFEVGMRSNPVPNPASGALPSAFPQGCYYDKSASQVWFDDNQNGGQANSANIVSLCRQVTTLAPTSAAPTATSDAPTAGTREPTTMPSSAPSTVAPSLVLSASPITMPSSAPSTAAPSLVLSASPTVPMLTSSPSTVPTQGPSAAPSAVATTPASMTPPTAWPTPALTFQPSAVPTATPSISPTRGQPASPTGQPSVEPTAAQSSAPTANQITGPTSTLTTALSTPQSSTALSRSTASDVSGQVDAGAGDEGDGGSSSVALSIVAALLLVGAIVSGVAFQRHRNKHRGGRLPTPDGTTAMTTNPTYHAPGQAATSTSATQQQPEQGAHVSLGVDGTAALPPTAAEESPSPLLAQHFEATTLPSITAGCDAEGALAYEPIPPPAPQPDYACLTPPAAQPAYEAIPPPVVQPEYEVISPPVLESDYEAVPPVLEPDYQEIADANPTGSATGVCRYTSHTGRTCSNDAAVVDRLYCHTHTCGSRGCRQPKRSHLEVCVDCTSRACAVPTSPNHDGPRCEVPVTYEVPVPVTLSRGSKSLISEPNIAPYASVAAIAPIAPPAGFGSTAPPAPPVPLRRQSLARSVSSEYAKVTRGSEPSPAPYASVACVAGVAPIAPPAGFGSTAPPALPVPLRRQSFVRPARDQQYSVLSRDPRDWDTEC